MKVLFIHNDYIRPSGEEAASGELARMLEDNGHEVRWFRKTSANIQGLSQKAKAFFLAIYNKNAAEELESILDEYNPDIVQIQNLYPFISTSIFKPLRQRGIPVVMRCPNYRLFCPNGLCLDTSGMICEKCFGTGHEVWCALKNCEGSVMKSLGYALRGFYARCSRNILDGVDTYIVQSDFQKMKFHAQGIPSEKIAIIPGIAPDITINDVDHQGDWVSFVGRVSREKGIDEFIMSARLNPDIPFKVAGNIDASFRIPSDLPHNLEFVGFLKGDDLNDFYLNSRLIVVPSKWYEGFPNVIVRAMLLKRVVVTTSIGAMQSIIRNDENGLLVPPADADALAEAISHIYYDTDACLRMGKEAMNDANGKYSRETIYNGLVCVYNSLVANKKSALC